MSLAPTPSVFNPRVAPEVISEDELAEVLLHDDDKPMGTLTERFQDIQQAKFENTPNQENTFTDFDTDILYKSLTPDVSTEPPLDDIKIKTEPPPKQSLLSIDTCLKFPIVQRVDLAGNWVTKHIVFVIFLPNRQVIKRRFSDFIWLRNILNKVYIGAFIPPLPERLPVALWPKGYVETRKMELELFVRRGYITPFIAADEVWQIFFSDSGGSFDKVRKRWDKEHAPLSIRQTCELLEKTFPDIMNEPLPDIGEDVLEGRIESIKHLVQENSKILQKVQNSCKTMVDSCVEKIDSTITMQQHLAEYERIITNRCEAENNIDKKRLIKVAQKNPVIISKSWNSWCEAMYQVPAIHDAYLVRNIKRNRMDFEALRECTNARAKVVKDLNSARSKAAKWKKTGVRSKDLSQKHTDDMKLEDLEVLSKMLYKLLTKQFVYIWQATQHRFSASMERFMAMQGRKFTRIKELWESSNVSPIRSIPLQAIQ